MRGLVALLALVSVTAIALPAQRSRHAAVDFAKGAVRITFDPAVAKNDRKIDKLLTTPTGWPLGGEPGGLLATTINYRFDRTEIPAGLYAVRLRHDKFATWLVLVPLHAIDTPEPGAVPFELPLLEAPLDSTATALDVRIDAGIGTAETIVFGYDTAHRKTIDRYSISTEPNRPALRLVIDWGTRRWTVPITALGSES